MADLNQLRKNATVVRDAQRDNENTAKRVGDLFLAVIDAFAKAADVADSSKDGIMTAELVRKIIDNSGVCAAFLKTTLQDKRDLFSYSIVLHRDGYGGPIELELPVHGGDDGLSSANCAAMIDDETFLHIADYIKHEDDILIAVEHIADYVKHKDDILKAVEYIPQVIDEVLSLPFYKTGQSTTLPGSKVFDLRSGKFLWKVKKQSGSITSYDYYEGKVGDMSVGTFPVQGKIYTCGKRTFIGVANGLSELFKV